MLKNDFKYNLFNPIIDRYAPWESQYKTGYRAPVKQSIMSDAEIEMIERYIDCPREIIYAAVDSVNTIERSRYTIKYHHNKMLKRKMMTYRWGDRRARPVECKKTGKWYNTLRSACAELDLSYSVEYQKLNSKCGSDVLIYSDDQVHPDYREAYQKYVNA